MNKTEIVQAFQDYLVAQVSNQIRENWDRIHHDALDTYTSDFLLGDERTDEMSEWLNEIVFVGLEEVGDNIYRFKFSIKSD